MHCTMISFFLRMILKPISFPNMYLIQHLFLEKGTELTTIYCVNWHGQDERRLANETDDRHPYLTYTVKQEIEVLGNRSTLFLMSGTSTCITFRTMEF